MSRFFALSITLLILLTLSLTLFPATDSHAFSFGGGFGGGDDSDDTCAEDNPVIVPGPLGSPVKLLQGDNELFIADYNRFQIATVSTENLEEPEMLFDTRIKKKSGDLPQSLKGLNKGKPLSLARIQWKFGHIYFVGNDDRKTLDLFWSYQGNTVLFKRLFKDTGIQALDMVVDNNSGRIYVVDGLHKEIKVLDFKGRLIKSFGGFGQLDDPKGITYDPVINRIIVTDYGDPRVGISASIKLFSRKGNYQESITGEFSRPQGVDSLNGIAYLADAMRGQVLEFDLSTGEMLNTYGCYGTSEGHLLLPMDVVVDDSRNSLYVADNRNGRISMLSLDTEEEATQQGGTEGAEVTEGTDGDDDPTSLSTEMESFMNSDRMRLLRKLRSRDHAD